jgi:hypothetical protein
MELEISFYCKRLTTIWGSVYARAGSVMVAETFAKTQAAADVAHRALAT